MSPGLSTSTLARGVAKEAAEAVMDATRVARFLRGRAEFRVRPDDVFISSYPRSGTTWLQHITHALYSGGDISFAHINDVAPWFERQLALGRVRARDFAALRSPRIFKSHLPRTWLPPGARYIYVQRDGRDVALSYFHFYRSHLGFCGDFAQFFERFLTGDLQYGSWFKHVAGWQAYANDPAQLIVHYEHLKRDLPGELARIARFCGTPLSAALSAQLCTLCDFAFMREHEAKFDHAASEPGGARRSGAFIRSGVSGAYQHALSAEQRKRFIQELLQPIRTPTIELHLPAFLH